MVMDATAIWFEGKEPKQEENHVLTYDFVTHRKKNTNSKRNSKFQLGNT